jgi:transcriptional regulator with XRE-family HTH domain
LALRKERERRGWTLDDLAHKAKIGKGDLSLLERGLIPAYPGWQERISKAFKMSRADLFCEVEDDER